jgi:hypothetical protein
MQGMQIPQWLPFLIQCALCPRFPQEFDWVIMLARKDLFEHALVISPFVIKENGFWIFVAIPRALNIPDR